MQSKNSILMILSAILLSALLPAVTASARETEWIVLHDNLPQEAPRYDIALKFTHTKDTFYDAHRQNLKSEKVTDGKHQKDYDQQIDLGTAIDGNRYIVLLKPADEVNILSNRSERPVMAGVLQIADKKTEMLQKGLVFLNRDLEIPLEVSPEQIPVPTDRPVSGMLEVDLYSNSPFVYEGRCRTMLQGTLSGSASTDNAFLTASLTYRGSPKQEDRYIELSLKPFSQNMSPAGCQGKITGTLTLGSAVLVVEKIAADNSQVVLAHLEGDLIQAAKQMQAPEIDKPFPPFTRVDLVRRRLVTLGDLTKQTEPDGYVILIFGDMKVPVGPYYGGMPFPSYLSLDETMISSILKKDCPKPMVIAFVCRQLSLSDLYEKWLGRDPEFYVLSDYSNPLNVRFGMAGMEPHMMRPPTDREETLRGVLKMDPQKVVTALIDANGTLLYLNPNAGSELADSLVRINNLMKEPENKSE